MAKKIVDLEDPPMSHFNMCPACSHIALASEEGDCGNCEASMTGDVNGKPLLVSGSVLLALLMIISDNALGTSL